MFTKTKSEVQVLREEVASLRKQLAEQREISAEYMRLHRASSLRKAELFNAVRRCQAFLEEATQ
jgi:FixJ family two-component response regulator